ncbi:MAG: NAD-dependent epimerase/dehydratase family protein [Acidimicrobiia bacterium]
MERDGAAAAAGDRGIDAGVASLPTLRDQDGWRGGRVLVTGAAGFIGSTLCDRLLSQGAEVVGVDCFTDNYHRSLKLANLARLERHEGMCFVDADLNRADLRELLDGVEVVFHQAGQPGVRTSWANGFSAHLENNLRSTQRLLEVVRNHRTVRRLVYASSSSVYGDGRPSPLREHDLPQPNSPYGVTKLAAEHLCSLYAKNYGVSTVSLRYFTVYGPRQRPDMAIYRLLSAAMGGTEFPLFGDGRQAREFTFVGDVVEANLRAGMADVPPGTVVNISGDSCITMTDLIGLVGDVVGVVPTVRRYREAAGDVLRTEGARERAASLLGWEPRTPLRDGLADQAAWHRSLVIDLDAASPALAS